MLAKLKKLSIVTKTSLAIVFSSALLLFIAGTLFIQSEFSIVDSAIKQSKSNSLNLLDTQKNENIAAMHDNVRFNTKVISDMSASMLYNVDNVALELSLRPFMDVREIMAIKVIDNLSNNPFIILWKDQDNGVVKKKSHSDFPPSVNTQQFFQKSEHIIYNHNEIGEVLVYYTDKYIVENTQKQQSEMEKEIAMYEKEINSEITNAGIYQALGLFAIVSTLIFVVIKSFNILEQKIEQRTQELENKNGELSNTLGQLQSTQQQLVESEKMASLGGLVAGVAHEINTPVGIGITAISHLEEKVQEFSRLYGDGKMKRSDLEKFLEASRQSTTIITTNLNRAAELIQSFKQVAVDQSSEDIRNFKMSEYIHEILISLRPKLKRTKHKINVECNDHLEVSTYAGAFSQVLTNLIMNSIIHAYGEEDEGHIGVEIKDEGDKVHLVYSDDGKGIPADNLKKIFEPFFTTKRGQGGSGLGLHIIYNIVTQKMNGTIDCQSTVGEGTTFTIIIPKHNAHSA